MKIRELPKEWQEKAAAQRTVEEYRIHLPISVAAGIRALAEMYPGRSETDLVTELLSAAMDELQEGFPYIQGNRIIAEDEFGDPLYEDVGPTPRFNELMQRHISILEQELARKR